MCGIAGIVTYQRQAERLEPELRAMTKAIAHRGNNGQGFFVSSNQYCLLAHRRLAIIDLSDAALQPMHTPDERYTIVFNGEIYNYRELAQLLTTEFDVVFATSSDTEVLLHAYRCWGPAMLSKLRGMFAFAIWDNLKEELFVARDHTGMKPFYWAYELMDGKPVFAFASELKGLLATSFVPREVNVQAITNFLTFGAINPPLTILDRVHSLLPGHYLHMSKNGPEQHRYWNPATIATNYDLDAEEIKDKTAQLLQESVALHMRADISVGAFLSGGIDSSTLVGLMSRLNAKSIETFSIGFKETTVTNELSLARIAAQKFGTNHHEVVISPQDFARSLPDFFYALDQPSVDGLNSFLVARETARHVSVAVSGLGGDELFLGYRYMKDLVRLWKNEKNPIAAKIIPALAQRGMNPGMVRSLLYRTQQDWVLHAAADKPEQQYVRTRQLFNDAELAQLLPRCSPFSPVIDSQLASIFANDTDWVNGLSKAELTWYTPGTLLRDADATAMASTLEVRFPFLDPVLMEHMLRIPSAHKLSLTQKGNKPLLTALFTDLLPPEVLAFTKHGFELPVGAWMKDVAATEIRRLQEIPWLNRVTIQQISEQFFTNPRNYHKLWALMVLVAWLERYCAEALYEKDFIYSSWKRSGRSRAQSAALGAGVR